MADTAKQTKAADKVELMASLFKRGAMLLGFMGANPKFGNNTTLESLVDDYAVFSKIESEAKKKKELIKEVMKSKRKDDTNVIIGETYNINIGLSERNYFNADLAKSFLTEAQVKQCTSVTDVETWRVVDQ